MPADGTPKKADVGQFFDGVLRRSRMNPVQRLQWTRDAKDHATLLVTRPESTASERAVFWIRLYGCVAELWTWVVCLVKTIDEEGCGNEALESLLRDFLGTATMLRAQFNEDELLWIEYRRNVECHTIQDGYEHTSVGNKLTFRSKVLGREVDKDVMREARERVLSSWKNDELTMAKGFAARSAVLLAALNMRMEAYVYATA